jgi:hypothetical protein
MYQITTLPYTLFLTYLPRLFSFGAFQTDRLTEKFVHPLFPNSFFFPLSARGPSTRRRKFTGLAELRGGWPIELKYLEGTDQQSHPTRGKKQKTSP